MNFHYLSFPLILWLFAAAPSARAETGATYLSSEQIAVLQGILSAQTDTLTRLDCVRADVTSLLRINDTTISTNGTLTWHREKFRYSYDWLRRAKTSELERSGILLHTPSVQVDFARSDNRAFRSVRDAKGLGREFFLLPNDSWFHYNLEFPYREIITADESFDYGVRHVVLDVGSARATLTIDNPHTPGKVVFDFDLKRAGLLSSVRNSDGEGIKYQSSLEWTTIADGVNFPRKIIKQRRDRSGKLRPKFKLVFSNVEILQPSDLPDDCFEENSLDYRRDTEITTYFPDRSPVVRNEKGQPSLEELGDQLRDTGFAAPESE